jgi:hypothetical protein
MNDKISLVNGGAYHLSSKPAESEYCRHGGHSGYEQPSKQSSVLYINAKKIV